MTSAADDELIAQLRRSLGSEPNSALTSSDDPIIEEGPTPPPEPAARVVSPAAMAIADQIMGLEAVLAARGGARLPLGLRGANGDEVSIEQECTIGRQEGEHRLTIRDGRVSRSHALIRNEVSSLNVCDLGSSNGTFRVRDNKSERVGREPVELRLGDRVETVDGLLLAEVVEVQP